MNSGDYELDKKAVQNTWRIMQFSVGIAGLLLCYLYSPFINQLTSFCRSGLLSHKDPLLTDPVLSHSLRPMLLVILKLPRSYPLGEQLPTSLLLVQALRSGGKQFGWRMKRAEVDGLRLRWSRSEQWWLDLENASWCRCGGCNWRGGQGCGGS